MQQVPAEKQHLQDEHGAEAFQPPGLPGGQPPFLVPTPIIHSTDHRVYNA